MRALLAVPETAQGDRPLRAQSKDTLYFTLLLLAFTLVIIFMSIGYDRDTRLMPLLIGIPTFFLIVLQVLFQFYPKLQRFFEIDIFSPSGSAKQSKRAQEDKGSLLFPVALVCSYFILLLLLGFLVATPIYLMVFFRLQGKLSWPKCILAAGIAWLLLYLVFSVGMKFILFEGLLFGGRL
jgi:hypothetical protein